MKNYYSAALIPAFAAGIIALPAGAAPSLTINGKTVSSDVRVIGGKAYAPIADIARAMNLTSAKHGGVYALSSAGGANQDNGASQGKVGDELFTGKWRFKVIGVEVLADNPQYVDHFYQQAPTIKPKSGDDVLVVVSCQMRNGLKKAQQPLLTERLPGDTALADDQGRSYIPIEYDARQETNKWGSYGAESLLPGAKAPFALVFSVPKNTVLKSLVFSAMTYPDDVGRSGVDVRVQLAPGP